ncbi:hypothetical protein [Mucilaginibacter arboris]|uniref:Uncharacterized protein n=1 Tax=Mucilaginibacter arboris TaxID=2682090 RepID=A0A7K1SS82_9SPHI|nr:hypothetical protein [Mucilaginibacter arboris]MVN20176.1 hypothetical protein [Mucilaginibacter arboris]
MGLLAMAAVSSCSVHTREYNRRPPRHDRHHDDHRDGDHRDEHDYRNY